MYKRQIQDLGDTLDSPDLPDTDEGDFNDSFHSVPDDNSAPNSPTTNQPVKPPSPEARTEPQASGSSRPATRAQLKKTGVTVPDPPYLDTTVERAAKLKLKKHLDDKAASLKLKQQLDEEEAAHRTRLAVIEKQRQAQLDKKKKNP